LRRHADDVILLARNRRSGDDDDDDQDWPGGRPPSGRVSTPRRPPGAGIVWHRRQWAREHDKRGTNAGDEPPIMATAMPPRRSPPAKRAAAEPTPPPPVAAAPAPAPLYKRIPGMWGDDQHVVVVDAFEHPLPNYVHVLSHFHSDHYHGLDASWTHGVIHVRAVAAPCEYAS